MILIQDFESQIIAAHNPNYIILGEVEDRLTVSIAGSFTEDLEFVYTPSPNGTVVVNILEITKQLYLNLENYQDPFDYTETVLYTESENYHYGKLNMDFTDGDDSVITKELTVVNAALQVNECITMGFYIGKPLQVYCNSAELDDLYNFDYELNMDLH